jgi:hypothetical protein
LSIFFEILQKHSLSSLPSDPSWKLDILGHNCHPLGMDCKQVVILKQTHKVGLSCLLEGKDSMALERKISLHIKKEKTQILQIAPGTN